MTKILYDHPDLRLLAIEHGSSGEPLKHIGKAQHVYKLKLPMSIETGKRLFALI